MSRVEEKIALVPLFEQPTPLTLPTFDPYDEALDVLAEQRVLVVGAGALGCDALKCLVMSGYEDITIVDMDTIELSNLNRQFMFRNDDIGKYKADVAAAFLKSRRPSITVDTKTSKIQELGKKWMAQFNLVLLCLDNNEARLWINECLVDLVQYKPYTASFETILNDATRYQLFVQSQPTLSQPTSPAPTMTDFDELNTFQQQNKPELVYSDDIHPQNEFAVKVQGQAEGVTEIQTGYKVFGMSDVMAELFRCNLPGVGEPNNKPMVITTPTAKVNGTVINYYEGGTEGWVGHYRALRPGTTYCIACQQGMLSKPKVDLHTHLCTIANVPRIPEHCIMYAHQLLWPKLITLTSRTEYEMVPMREDKPPVGQSDEVTAQSLDTSCDPAGVEFDADNMDHIYWCLDRATERALKFKITVPTYAQTLGVIKNTIPAISSTNSLIASLCVNSAFKYETEAMNPFKTGDLIDQEEASRYSGFHTSFTNDVYTTGMGINTSSIVKNSACPVCSDRFRVSADKDMCAFLPILALIFKEWYNNDPNLVFDPIAFEIKDVYNTTDPNKATLVYFRASASPGSLLNWYNQQIASKSQQFSPSTTISQQTTEEKEQASQQEGANNSNQTQFPNIPRDMVNLFKPISDPIFGAADPANNDPDNTWTAKIFQILDLNQTKFKPIKFEFQGF